MPGSARSRPRSTTWPAISATWPTRPRPIPERSPRCRNGDGSWPTIRRKYGADLAGGARVRRRRTAVGSTNWSVTISERKRWRRRSRPPGSGWPARPPRSPAQRRDVAPRLARGVQRRLRDLAMPNAVIGVAVEGPDPADAVLSSSPPTAESSSACTEGGLRRRAGPGHARAAPGPQRGARHAAVRRGRFGDRRHRGDGGGSGAGRSRNPPPGAGGHTPSTSGRLCRSSSCGREARKGRFGEDVRSAPSSTTIGSPSCPACCRARPTASRPDSHAAELLGPPAEAARA